MDVVESREPFFRRSQTSVSLKKIVKEILSTSSAKSYPRINIYCGAGVTIDRSGLDWRKMVDGLLSHYVTEKQDREDLFKAHEVLGVASLCLAHYYQDYGPEHYTMRVADQLRLLLYGAANWNSGSLASEVIQLCKAMKTPSFSRTSGGYIIATPNYDAYLAEMVAEMNGVIQTTSVTNEGSLHPQDTLQTYRAAGDWRAVNLPPWVSDEQLLQKMYELGSIVQLHGLIPRDGQLLDGRVFTPVIDELDYIDSEYYTTQVLKALLKAAPTIFIGTSMQDRPVLKALQDTKEGFEDLPPRYLLSTLGTDLSTEDPRRYRLRRQSSERFARFGVEPIYVDYHFQVPAFLAELSRGISIGYSGDVENSYESRLDRWASSWPQYQIKNDNQLIRLLLSFAIDEVKEILGIMGAEILKAELWVRDNPSEFRGLRLWESTASRQVQEESARKASFNPNTTIAAVKAFQEGRPVFSYLPDGEKPNQRWRTYLAIPLTLERGTSSNTGRLPVGTLVVASMRSSSQSGLYQLHKRASLKHAVETLSSIGQFMIDDSNVACDFSLPYDAKRMRRRLRLVSPARPVRKKKQRRNK